MEGKKPGLAEILALSSAAAVVSKTAAAPIERIKLLLQTQNEIIKAGRLSEPYKGIIDCTVRTFRTEGVLPFWRGNLASCLIIFPSHALSFAFKDVFKTIFKSPPNEAHTMKFSKNIISGGVAGALSIGVLYSLDYARTRLAADVKATGKGAGERQFNGLIDVYTKTLKSDGFVGLYRGFVISCVGIVVYRGFYFGLYDSLKPILLGSDANLFVSFCLGYGVTMTSGLLAYPMDTIRRRMMMRSCEAVKYRGSIDCAKQIIKNEGFLPLWKGAGVSILQGVAGAAILVGYDSFKAAYVRWRLK